MANVNGTNNPELIDASDGVTNGNDNIQGLGGNDTIYGLGGNDIIQGGAGDDLIYGHSANTVVGSGDDTISSFIGSDTVYSQDGDDVINLYDATNCYIDAGSGNDVIYGGNGGNTILGGEGNDDIDLTYSGTGLAQASILDGEGGNDTIVGSAFADTIWGGTGDNEISTGAGNDIVYVEDSGDNTITGGGGTEYVHHKGIADIKTVVIDFDRSNADLIIEGDDTISGNEIRITGYFNGGNNVIEWLYDDAGNDIHIGSVIKGSDAADTISGTAQADYLIAGNGIDVIQDVGNQDYARGGNQSDIFEITLSSNGSATIGDFEALNNDEKIDLTQMNLSSILTMTDLLNATTQYSNYVEIDLGSDRLLQLVNVNKADLDTNDFIIKQEQVGTSGNDVIYSTIWNDSINAGDGNDVIVTSEANLSGDDTINGGNGVDLLQITGSDIDSDDLSNVDSVEAILFGNNDTHSLTLSNNNFVDSAGGLAIIDFTGALSFGATLSASAVTGVLGVYGGGSDDLLTTGSGADSIISLAGNDTISSGLGADSLDGGNGADSINAGSGADTITTGSGSDVIVIDDIAGDADVIADFTAGTGTDYDKIDLTEFTGLSSFVDILNASTSSGGDVIIDLGDSQTITLQNVNKNDLRTENFVGVASVNIWQGTTGKDNYTSTVTGANEDELFLADIGDDTINGGAGADTMYGDADDDSLMGGAGDDLIYGISGTDTLEGGEGNDTLLGGSGTDLLKGGNGNDYMEGGGGADTVFGDGGNDTINGGSNVDYIDGGSGADSINGSGNTASETLIGGSGDDTIIGGEGTDIIYGGADADSVNGGSGADILYGEDGNDTLLASAGNDTITGGNGVDRLKGDSGSDDFIWNTASESGIGSGNRDVIVDFGNGGDDIDLSGFSGSFTFRSGGSGTSDFTSSIMQVAFEQTGGNTIVYVDSTGNNSTDFEIELTGLVSLASSDFILA